MTNKTDKEVFAPTVKDFEHFMKRIAEVNNTLEIHVGEDIEVGERAEVRVTDRQKGFLQKIAQAFSEFQLKEVEFSIPGLAKFKFVRKNKE